jgi:hypothetical protein
MMQRAPALHTRKADARVTVRDILPGYNPGA